MSSNTLGRPAFVRDGDVLTPKRWTRSGWGDMMMGRYLAGLVAFGAEQHADAGWLPARLTVDMFRPAPLQPLRLVTRVVRDGRRIRVVDVEVVTESVVVCRGSVAFLQEGENPVHTGWLPPPVALTDPDELPVQLSRRGLKMPWDQRNLGDWASTSAARGCWQRETQAFVEDAPLSGFLRVALAVDNANGVLNGTPHGLPFINADLTLTLTALPSDDWVAIVGVSRAVDNGVSSGVVDVYDRTRRLGQVSMIGLSDRRNL